MEWALDQGDRVRYRSIGDDRETIGTVRKAIHILTAQRDEVPVYIIAADEEDPVILGDGEILEKLPLGDLTPPAPLSREARGERDSPLPVGEGPGARSVLLLDTDLFFSVKITDTLKHAGYATTTARTETDFARALAERPPAIALVNTAARRVDFRRAIHLARDAGVLVIAFGSHVDLRTQEEARQAGATRVIANSKLAADLPGVLERTLRRSLTGGPHGADADRNEDESSQ